MQPDLSPGPCRVTSPGGTARSLSFSGVRPRIKPDHGLPPDTACAVGGLLFVVYGRVPLIASGPWSAPPNGVHNQVQARFPHLAP